MCVGGGLNQELRHYKWPVGGKASPRTIYSTMHVRPGGELLGAGWGRGNRRRAIDNAVSSVFSVGAREDFFAERNPDLGGRSHGTQRHDLRKVENGEDRTREHISKKYLELLRRVAVPAPTRLGATKTIILAASHHGRGPLDA